MDFVKPTVFAIPFFILTVALEWWAVKTNRATGRYETKDAITSLAMGLGSVAVDTVFAALRSARPGETWVPASPSARVIDIAHALVGERKVEINSDRINQGFVLGNKVMVGTVNASPHDFRTGVDDLIKADALFPGWLSKLLTTPIAGLENYDQMIRALTEDHEAIKVFVEVARAEQADATEAVAELVSAGS